MSDSVRPRRQQPTRLHRPWDSPGKNTGVGCHGLLQCMKGKREREVAQLCSTLPDPMDCSLAGSFAHGIFQARGLEWVAFSFIQPSCYVCSEWMWFLVGDLDSPDILEYIMIRRSVNIALGQIVNVQCERFMWMQIVSNACLWLE